MNRVDLIGNLGRDPEIRYTQDGQPIANLNLATNERWKDKQTGERKERSEWHRVVIFNEHLVGVIEKFTKKGSKIRVCGKLATRKWTDQENKERYTTEVVLDRFGGEVELLDKPQNGPGSAASPDDYGNTSTIHDDEIPY